MNACLFAVFMQTKKVMLGDTNKLLANGKPRALSVPETFLCGGVAGVAVSPLVGPIELIKTQLQINKGKAGTSAYEGTVKVNFSKKKMFLILCYMVVKWFVFL